MSFFRWRKKSLNISEADPVYKVRYLGNIHTCMMKGEGCVDKPASILWNNYLQSSHQALDMKIVVSVSGIKAFTKEQGLMQYSSHKISYILAHPQYPRMFLWVYRHEGRKMKLDLRCHAVLCKSEAKAKLLNVQLHDKLSFALKEFVRDKRRKHNSRLIFEKTNAELSNGSILPLRQQMLCQGGKFKPPVSKMNSAPKLGSIYELDEREEERMSEVGDVVEYEEIEEERMEELTKQLTNNNVFMNPKQNITHCEEEEDEEGIGGMNDSIDGEEDDDDDDEDDDDDDDDDDLCTESDMSDGIDSLALDPESDNVSMCSDHVCPADTLKRDEIHFLLNKKKKSDSDGESSESGFSDSSKEIGLYRVDENEKPSEECQGSNHGGGITQCDKDIHCPNNNNNNNNGSCDKSTTTTTTTTTIATNGNTTTTTKGSSRRHHNRNKNTRDGSETQYLHPKNTTTTTTTNNNCKTKPNGNSNSNNNNNNNSHIESPLRITTTTTTTNQSNSLSTSSSSSSSTTTTTSPSLLPSKSSSSSTTTSSSSCTTRTTRTALSPKSSKFNQQLNNSGKSPSSPSQTSSSSSSSSSVSSSIRDVTKMVRLL